MTPKQLISYAARRYSSPNVAPMLVLGPPGIGKTAIASDVALKLGVPLHLWPVMARQGVDVGGYPQPDAVNGITRFLPAEGLVKAGEEGGLLFLDELPQCPETDQPSYLKLVHERLAGERKLPDTLQFMAAGNRPQDGSGRNRLLEALKERFVVVSLMPSSKDWLDWSASVRINPLVRNFITANGDRQFAGGTPTDTFLFSSPDLKRGHSEGSPNPRAWHMLANELDAVPNASQNDILEAGAGIVGSPAMTEFRVWLDLKEKLVNPAAVLNDPDRVHVPVEPSALFVSVSMVADYASQQETPDMLNNAARFYLRLPGEFAAFGCYELFCATLGKPNDFGKQVMMGTSIPDGAKLFSTYRDIFNKE